MTLTIRPLTEQDLPEARRILSLAFGTVLGLPEPEKFQTELDFIGMRYRADHSAALVAEVDGEVVGSSGVMRWGSVGLFNPLSIRPDMWVKGIGPKLFASAIEMSDTWGVTHTCFFTFAHSLKNVSFFQKFDFWPRFLTATMSKPVRTQKRREQWSEQMVRYSSLAPNEQVTSLQACRTLTDTIYPGLDVVGEIEFIHDRALGDTVLFWNGTQLVGLAVCQWGTSTEAGAEKCYVRFGTVRSGISAEERFDRLLTACESVAADKGKRSIVVGVNVACYEAYRFLLARGFRTTLQGVSMHRNNEPGYSRPGIYVIDDWR